MSNTGFALSLDAMVAWCDRNNITYQKNDRLQQLAIPTPLGREYAVRVIPHPSRGMMTFAMAAPFAVPEDRADVVARAAALANASSFMGAWVLVTGKGELYFRVTTPTDGVSYEDSAVRFLLQVVIGTVQTFAPRFRAIALEGAGWETALTGSAPLS